MDIFSDFILGISIMLSRTSMFGLSWGVVLLCACLVFLIVLGAVMIVHLLRQLACMMTRRSPDYTHVRQADREWYRLASIILLRSECVIGKRARTVVRGLPGIQLDEEGVFESLGAVPFEGLVVIAAALKKDAGMFALLPLFFNQETRRVLHLIPRT